MVKSFLLSKILLLLYFGFKIFRKPSIRPMIPAKIEKLLSTGFSEIKTKSRNRFHKNIIGYYFNRIISFNFVKPSSVDSNTMNLSKTNDIFTKSNPVFSFYAVDFKLPKSQLITMFTILARVIAIY